MTVGDITAVLEQFAPLGIQEQWDNSGLLIGSPSDPVTAVLVGFDCTPELISELKKLFIREKGLMCYTSLSTTIFHPDKIGHRTD